MSPAGYENSQVVLLPSNGSELQPCSQEEKGIQCGRKIGFRADDPSWDSDAASALKRVTGLTVVGGKFVYVRGWERYSASLLGQSSLPSTDPERRVVPLDLSQHRY